MRIDGVIFDCDGVLVDSEPITCHVLMTMLGELGVSMSLEQTLRTFVGRSLRDDPSIVERLTGAPLPGGWYDDFKRRRDDALARGTPRVAGIERVLAHLAEVRRPFAVASGADRAKMRITLGISGLLPHFETPDATRAAAAAPPVVERRGTPLAGSRLFGADMVERAKPAPDVYLLAARALGLDPARCAVIEDTPTGTAAGIAAGSIVLGYCAHTDPRELLAAGAAAVFDDMRRLPALLDS